MRNHPRFWLTTAMIVLGAILRVLPHPWNFTPVGAMALFAGATYARRRDALLVPMLTMLLGDLLLEVFTGDGLHTGMPIIYGCFALTVFLGWFLRSNRNSPIAVAGAATLSATVFYIVTNFWVWRWSALYPKTLDGLMACYVAAIPYYRNNLAADWLYSALLFGTFVWAEHRFPVLRTEAVVK